MANNLYTTKTASLKATRADVNNLSTKKIKVNGKDVVTSIRVEDEREYVTAHDLWCAEVELENNEIIFTDGGIYHNSMTPWRTNITEVIDRRCYDSLGFYCNLKTDSIVSGDYMFNGSNCHLTRWNSDLPKLERGWHMFYGCTELISFKGNMPSLVGDGNQVEGSCVDSMFSYSNLSSFEGDMPNLVNGTNMFCYSNLALFVGDMPNLENGSGMFCGCNVSSFVGDLSKLENGTDMFNDCNFYSLWDEDMPKLTNGTRMFKNCDLITFKNRLDSLEQGEEMFAYCNLSSFSSKINGLVWAKNMFYGNGRMTFAGDLYTLNEGWGMFEETWLDIESLTHIAETISKMKRNITIGLQYDIDLVEAKKLLTEITNKGWTVYTYLEHHNGITNQIAKFNPEDGYISGEDNL